MRFPSRGVRVAAGVIALCIAGQKIWCQNTFFRGDCNASREGMGRAVNIADAAAVMNRLFGEGLNAFQPPCEVACDCDDNGSIDADDALCILVYLFENGEFPPAPGPGLTATGLPNPNGVEPAPAGTDPTADALMCVEEGGHAVVTEVCDNGVDDDDDRLTDERDPDCQKVFACGRLVPVYPGPHEVGPVEGAIGSTVEVGFFLLNPEDDLIADPRFDHLEGFSMALTFCCDLSAEERFDISGTLLEAIEVEYVVAQADNDPDDGDGCELVIAVLADAWPPLDGKTIPPLPDFQRLGTVSFMIREGTPCGDCCSLEFTDGINGTGIVPVENLIVWASEAHRPAQFVHSEVCVREQERFYRGDCNFSGGASMAVDLSDAAAILAFLFAEPLHQFAPPCLDACDCNDDGRIDMDDALCVLQYHLQFGAFPPTPGPGLEFTGEPRPNGVRETPPGVDPTEDLLDCVVGGGCGGGRGAGPGDENCFNFVDDDADGLIDFDDPDCQGAPVTFACGSGESGNIAHEPPGPVGAPPGSSAEVNFYLRTLEDNEFGFLGYDHVQGFSMALTFPCDLEASDVFDTSGTILEALGAEFITTQADNDSSDGDGCELVIGVLIEVTPPYDRRTISPFPGFQRVGSVDFRARESAECGSCLPIEFVDGIDGRGLLPVRNLASTQNETIPALRWGTLFCVGDADEDGDGRLETCLEPLTAGDPIETVLTPSSPTLLRRFEAAAGETIVFTLTDDDPLDANALYVRWEGPAGPTSFDHAADARGKSGQRLVFPARDGVGHVLVQGNVFHSGANQVRLELERATLALEGISASFMGTSGTGALNATVLGAGFDASTAFSLAHSGDAVISSVETVIVATDRAEVRFELEDVPHGTYDLVADDAKDATARLESVFEVMATTKGARLEATLGGADSARHDRLGRLTLSYQNTGDVEMIAPLFKVVGPPGTELWLERASQSSGNELQVLGIHPYGVPGWLPPGGSGSLAIAYRSATCTDCRVSFELQIFEPDAGAPVGWASLPAPLGMTPAEWDAVHPELERELGSTWSAYHESLARLATRLSHRGLDAASVTDLFRFAVQRAQGRPTSAILGRISIEGSQAPLQGQHVLALSGGEVEASALTDEAGAFVLGGLRDDGAYELAVVDHVVVMTNVEAPVVIPPGNDRLAVEVTVRPGAGAVDPTGPTLDEGGLPEEPLASPVYEELANWHVQLVSSWTPQDKAGPVGKGEENLIRGSQPVDYTIYFENDREASVRRVVIIDRLDTDLDWTTLELLDVQIGNLPEQRVALDTIGQDLFSGFTRSPGEARYRATHTFPVLPLQDANPEETVLVQLDVEVDLLTGQIRWEFGTAAEPSTEAFLSANCAGTCDDCGTVVVGDDVLCRTGRGEGQVSFRVWPFPDLAEGTEIFNEATVYLDGRATPQQTWSNRIGDFIERGFIDSDDARNITDAVYLLAFLFLGGPPPPCPNSADVDGDGVTNITDAVYLLAFLFLGGPEPPVAQEGCGENPVDL